jgi:hypothetical protein
VPPSMQIAALNHDAALQQAMPAKPKRASKPGRRYGPPKASRAAVRQGRARYGL